MGRGGSSGGGGHSSGGHSSGGSRSSSGFRSSSGGPSRTTSSRSVVGRGGRGVSSGGGYRPTPPPPPRSYGHRPPPPPPPRHYGRTYNRSYGRRSSPGSIIGTAVALVILFVVIFVLAGIGELFSSIGGSGGGGSNANVGNITASTVAREKLDRKYVNETDYFTDTIGWISNKNALVKGMKEFFNKTGVQPYLYLTERVDGSSNPSDAQLKKFSEDLYDELFTDEGHFLVVFQNVDGSDQFTVWTVGGAQTKTILDKEAIDIFYDYLDTYYWSDKSEEAMFSDAFADAATRMMTKTKAPLNPIIPIVIVIGVIVVIVILVKFFKYKQEAKQRELETTEIILNTDVTQGSSFQDTSLQDLENRYTNNDGQPY